MVKCHPETEKFILYLDNARYFHAVMVREWMDALERETGVRFPLEYLPAYSRNLNLTDRLWRFLKEEALSTWHRSFEETEAAVPRVLDHLEEYREQLATRRSERFQLWADDVWSVSAQSA